MVDVWPAALPQYLLVDGYAEGMTDGRLVSRMDAGPATVRRRSSAAPRPLQGSMLMYSAQVATLRTFVKTTLIGGVFPFDFPDPVTGGTFMVRFAGSLPRWTFRGGDTWDVSLDLEVLSIAVPLSVSLDFSDADNSGYLALLEDI